MNPELSDKVVLITGASGGIGSAIARKFADEGARLVLHYRSSQAKAKALQDQLGCAQSMVARADLTKETEVAGLFARARQRFGRVDTLVANAGSWETRDVPLHRLPLQQWQRTLAAVLTSAFLSLREFLKLVAQ